MAINDTAPEFAIYQGTDGSLRLRSDTNQETIWADKKQIAAIFAIDRSVVSRHIKNIFTDQELYSDEVCAYFAHTTIHGSIIGKTQTKTVEYYNLDMILSIG